MASYTQAKRAMAVTTPLGADVLLLVGFTGREGISQLFHFQLDLVAEVGKEIAFDKLLGQPVTVRVDLPGGKQRHFNGICNRFSQGESDTYFTSYQMDVVPKFWLLTRRARSRIFQHKSVPVILKEVLQGLDVTFDLPGTFYDRDYCVQYRETDFNFACRVMEEEGIYYYFKHSDGGHPMVVAHTPQGHAELPGGKILYRNLNQPVTQPGDFIYDWTKTQELTAGKYTLWDHCFELPHKHLEADKTVVDKVAVGQASHALKVGDNGKLELYDWPGEYAQRFDGVEKGGGDQPDELKKIFEDNKRTVNIRMQQEAATAVVIQGASNCRHLVSGHKFSLTTLPADPTSKPLKAEGSYVLTGVSHSARFGGEYRSGDWGAFTYTNSFTAIPMEIPFRPPRATPKPVVPGTQTAVVVGPKGKEIFTDKYGRVKVQFHWDREGKSDADSSCWIRVAQPWAGKRWGTYFLPRIGQEVIVDFLEGDPDQPIVVGSVYNADQMHPYLGKGPDKNHPHDPNLTGVKSNTTPGGVGFNEFRFDDTKDKQQIFMHAERNMDVRIKNDLMELVKRDKHLHIERHHAEQIEGNMLLLVGGGEGGNQDLVVKKDKKELVEGANHVHVKKDRNEKVDMNQSLTVGMNQDEKVGMNHALEAGMAIHIKAGLTLVLEAGLQLTLKVGGNFVDLSPAGVAINGLPMVLINSGGAPGSGAGANPTAPEDAQEAKPEMADDAKTGAKSAPG